MRPKTLMTVVIASLGAAMLVAALLAAAAGSSRNAVMEVGSRGGTLRVNSPGDLTTDPGLAVDTESWAMLYTTQLLLMNFPEKTGKVAGQLIPEAATSFPTTSQDGKTYTFHIRPGLRFSDGSPVTAACFQRAWERNLSPKMNSGNPVGVVDHFQDAIVGGRAFNEGKTQSISGITAKGLTITFHLTKPNPTFLAYLGVQWFGAVKPDTPYSSADNFYPSAGPYYIQSRDVGRSLVEVRNPYYRGSRPANPDKIVWTMNVDQDQSFLQVKAGQADIDAAGPPPSANAVLASQYGINKSRFFVGPTMCVGYWALNTSRPPFNNVNYRKAVNWAIDRPALVRLFGKFVARRTDQVLPPGVLGYKPYDIYAMRGANVAEAKKYAPHGIPGTIVLVHSFSQLSLNMAQVVAYDLRQIGAHTRDEPLKNPYDAISTRGVDMDMARVGWCVDFYDPYGFINNQLDGRSIRAENNTNYAYLNSPKLNRQMDHAASLTGSARAAAYAALDREIMADYAPWVPVAIFNSVFFVSARVTNFLYSPYFNEPAFNALAVSKRSRT